MDQKQQRKPTLKEMMIMQGKIPRDGQASPGTAGQKQPGLKERMAKTGQQPQKLKTDWQETRDNRIKTMLEQDPEQAAALLKRLFLDGKK